MGCSQQTEENMENRLLKRMASSERFRDTFWSFFTYHVAEKLSNAPTVVDIGCGAGRFLEDFRFLYPDATLYGYDKAPEMIAQSRGLQFSDGIAKFYLHDVTVEPLSLASESVDLVVMSAVLHLVEDPLQVLMEVKRLLKPREGIFLFSDWTRTTIKNYVGSRLKNIPREQVEQARHLWVSLFPVHNRYSVQDWKWLMSTAGFRLIGSDKSSKNTVVMAHRPSRSPAHFLL